MQVKKVISTVLAVLLCLILADCGNRGGGAEEQKKERTPVSNGSAVLGQNAQETEAVISTNENAISTEQDKTAKSEDIIYKIYFYKNFSSNDPVCLADVTHDGRKEMIAVGKDRSQNDSTYDIQKYLYVYTIAENHVTLIYMEGIPNSRVTWYITGFDGSCNLVKDVQGIWQGSGTATATEFFLTPSGNTVEVSSFSQDFGTNGKDGYIEYDVAQYLYGRKVEEKYGENFSNLCFIASDDDLKPTYMNSQVVFN